MARQQAAHRKRANNKVSIFVITVVVLMITIVAFVKCAELEKKVSEYDQVEQQLEEQIAREEARTAELVEYEKYTQTMKYIEDVAKSKLGLVYEGEIIFKQE